MDEHEAGRHWDQNADVWTLLTRQGWDVYRDLLNTPAFLDFLPDVSGLAGVDLGCGEGHNTRLVARRGARMWAADISPTFVRHARSEEAREPLGIRYAVASAQRLPFADRAFDFAAAFMSLMDMPQPDAALREAFRVLKPGGFLQFSISHPCFDTPHRKLLRDAAGWEYAVEVGRYFDQPADGLAEWLFSAAPKEVKAGLRPFRTPRFHRPLSHWLNGIMDAGFRIERVSEPRVNEETAAQFPSVRDTRIVSYFLHVRCRKPAM